MRKSRLLSIIEEFKPSLLFIAKFLTLYLILNVAYGFYVESFERADPVTTWVTERSSNFIDLFGEDTQATPHSIKAIVTIQSGGQPILSVYEGCNGLNVVIVFISFLASFPGYSRNLLWFVPLGILIIHISNLARIGLLYWVTSNHDRYLYFTHKYFFTAIIYIIVLVLWYLWVTRINRNPNAPKATSHS